MRRVANSESWSKSGGGENFDRTAWLWLGDKAMAADEVNGALLAVRSS